jgi:hypothetical protein
MFLVCREDGSWAALPGSEFPLCEEKENTTRHSSFNFVSSFSFSLLNVFFLALALGADVLCCKLGYNWGTFVRNLCEYTSRGTHQCVGTVKRLMLVFSLLENSLIFFIKILQEVEKEILFLTLLATHRPATTARTLSRITAALKSMAFAWVRLFF